MNGSGPERLLDLKGLLFVICDQLDSSTRDCWYSICRLFLLELRFVGDFAPPFGLVGAGKKSPWKNQTNYKPEQKRNKENLLNRSVASIGAAMSRFA